MTDYERGWRDGMAAAGKIMQTYLADAVRYGGGREAVRTARILIRDEMDRRTPPPFTPTCPPDCVPRRHAVYAVGAALIIGFGFGAML